MAEAEQNNTMTIEIETGTSKKTGKDWKGVRVTIGKFTRVIFPYPSQWQEIERVINENRK